MDKEGSSVDKGLVDGVNSVDNEGSSVDKGFIGEVILGVCCAFEFAVSLSAIGTL